MKRIGSYKNGNYVVHMFDDGTKVRVNNLDFFSPSFPESIDMKICNRCDMGCPMCHEQSVYNGALADLNHPILNSLHPYTELAIGGGNPLEHPDLESFLRRMRDWNVICNMTVHVEHFIEYYDTLRHYRDEGLIHGLGISVNQFIPQTVVDAIKDFPNAVIHVIAGIVSLETLETLYDQDLKILILGYKDFGRGHVYGALHPNITFAIDDLAKMLPSLADHFALISFDNLAIKQLGLKDKISKQKWDACYMGDDGQFTMYIDLVNQEYAISSVSTRHPLFSDNIDDVFKAVQKEKNGGTERE